MKGVFAYLKKELSSFLTLFAIIAAGTALFLACYLFRQNVLQAASAHLTNSRTADLQYASSLHFGQEDINDIRALPGVEDAEGFFRLSAVVETDSFIRSAEMISLTQNVDRTELVSGRLPQAVNECVIGTGLQDAAKIGLGDTIRVSAKEVGAIALKTKELTVVGTARHPEFTTADFLVVSPSLAELSDEEGAYTHVMLRMSAYQNTPLASGRPAARELLSETLQSYSARFVNSRMKALETAAQADELKRIDAIDEELSALAAEEAELDQMKSLQEAIVEGYRFRIEEAQADLDAAQTERDVLKARFDELNGSLDEKRSELTKLQTASTVVKGSLAQAELLFGNGPLAPMIDNFRSCADSVLAAFLKADLTRASEFESAVDAIMVRWEAEWDSFRAGLTEEEAKEAEDSTGISLVAFGLQISNCLRDYGGSLQSAGSQRPGLQAEIREYDKARGTASLSAYLSQQITQVRGDIGDLEDEYQQTALLLSAQDEAVAEKQAAWEKEKQSLADFELENMTQYNSQETSLLARRLSLEMEKEELKNSLSEAESSLESLKQTAWIRQTGAAETLEGDISVLLQLAGQTALWGGLLAGLWALIYMFSFMTRRMRASLAEGDHPAIRRRGRTDSLLKLLLASALVLLPAAAAGLWLGRGLAGRLSDACLKSLSIPYEAAAVGTQDTLFVVISVMDVLLLGSFLACLAVSGKKRTFFYAPSTFCLAAGSCLTFGTALWLAWGLLRSRTPIGERLPSLLKLVPVMLILLLVYLLFEQIAALTSLERFNADQQRLTLYLMRAGGLSTELCSDHLYSGSLLPLFLGLCAGAAGGIFVCSRLQQLLMSAQEGLNSLPNWLCFGIASLLSLLLLFCSPSGVRKRAAQDALSQY